MSYKNILEIVSPKKPIFDANYAILSAPVRHIFIIATIWYLKQKSDKKDLNILEIGSWFGASTLSWAQGLAEYNSGLGKITCIDAWKPFFDTTKHKDEVYQSMESMLMSDAAYNIFMHNVSTISQNILCQHFRGKSDDTLPMLGKEQFDVIYIDADHTYKPVKKDILNSIPLIKDGGIICGDDLNLQMHECDQEIASQSSELDFIKDPKTGRNYHPGVTCAVDEIFGKVSSWGGFWCVQRQGDKWVNPSYSGMPVVYPKHFPKDAIKKAEDHFADLTV